MFKRFTKNSDKGEPASVSESEATEAKVDDAPLPAVPVTTKGRSRAATVVPPPDQLSRTQMAGLLNAIRDINAEVAPKEAINRFIEATVEILDCDRATVFMVDEHANELVIKVASGDVDIRIPTTAGIAGSVYTEGSTINIPDAYEDDRFNRDIDTSTGYRTKSILCLPVRDADDQIVAVLQCINKKGATETDLPPFTESDVRCVEYLASQVGVILRNTVLFEEARVAKSKVDALLDIVRSLHSDMGINSLLFTITNRTPALVEADRCTVFLVDKVHTELWSMNGAVEIRIPLSAGIAGLVATTGDIVNIPDAYADPRFNQAVDQSTGYRTRTILAMAIKDTSGNVIGVLQLINKTSGAFNEQDVELLQGFLGIAGSILQTGQLFRESQRTLSEMERANQVKVTRSRDGTHMSAIADEGGEEDSDEDDGGW